MECVEGISFDVERDIEMTLESGQTWLAFVSKPVTVQCKSSTGGPFMLQILNTLGSSDNGPLVVRLASVVINTPEFEADYKELLRSHANVFPGEATTVSYEISEDQAALVFDWDPQPLNFDSQETGELIAFAMPHHQDKLDGVGDFCADALLGSVCLVKGSAWVIVEDLPVINFQAPRQPDPKMLADLAGAVSNDLSYRVPQNFLMGAGDTYFSGKALAKLARILLIAEEIYEICGQRRRSNLRSLQTEDISEACSESTLPTQTAFDEALTHLQQGVEIWLNGTAQAPFLYDAAWGGVVSCGCSFDGGSCQNVFPDCPGLTDQGLNFGAGFYNDHHFHYGYHIYAAAVLAHFNHDWGRDNYEKVLMLVRDIANPSVDDSYFPQVRHKDWFHGSSWASGITMPASPTGMNQESTSEAIAGYEAVALFGKTMSSIFSEDGNAYAVASANTAYQIGRLLVATELRSAQRYWQVIQSDDSKRLFGSAYQHNVVGILWSSKVFFGTWFGNSPYLIYGIQLLPLTPISENRDQLSWVNDMFDSYAQTCDSACVSDGWSVQILALLATLGHQEKALGHAKNLTDAVFEGPGGNGHSLSNTIWYISTRPVPAQAYTLTRTYPWEEGPMQISCFDTTKCTEDVLGLMAGQYSCGTRITYLINQERKSEFDACYQIAVSEFPDVCGACNPGGSSTSGSTSVPSTPEPSTSEQSTSEPIADATLTQEAAIPQDGLTCGQPTTCTAGVLSAMAGDVSCGDRIKWLMTTAGMSEVDACTVVALTEFPGVCGACNPQGNFADGAAQIP